VSVINSLNPDVVLMAGDIIDESVKPFVEQQMGETLKLLKSKYGVYSVLGNHEYIGENGEQAVIELGKAGVQVLRDKTVKIGNSFYIVGRDDPSGERFSSEERKQLSALLGNIDSSLPIIVLDHRPTSLQEAKKSGADLQLSGHTHNAQIFPGQLITGIIYEKDYGYMKEGGFQLIVSSGYGTWGPPVRVGSISEIVDINLNFTGAENSKK
jgi:predicted MPP superfamily phosphohydrolase